MPLNRGPDEAKLTLTEHLTELRHRLLKGVLAVLITALLALAYAPAILAYAVRPLLEVLDERNRIEVISVQQERQGAELAISLEAFEQVQFRGAFSKLPEARAELVRSVDRGRPIDLMLVDAALVDFDGDHIDEVLQGLTKAPLVAYLVPRDSGDSSCCPLNALSLRGAELASWPIRALALQRLLRTSAVASGKATSGDKLVVLSPLEPFFAYIKIALVVGLFLACPVWLYQAWRFVAPGLYASEKRVVLPGVLAASVLFIGGGLFAYGIMFPLMFDVLLNQMMPASVVGSFTVQNYLTLLLQTTVAFGVVFELPLVMVLLSSVGLVEVATFRRMRKYAIVAALVVGAVLTPPDPISQVMMAVPIVVFFEIGILASSLLQRRGHTPDDATRERRTG